MKLFSARRIYRLWSALQRARIACWALGRIDRVWPVVSE